MNTLRKRILVLSCAVLLITALYYVTAPRHVYYHTLFRDLYFLPLILSAFWFGLEGALLTSGAITSGYMPILVLNWQGFSQVDFSRILEILLFNVIALILGYISGREKAHQRALREAESLVAMGKALSAAAHDMRGPLTAIAGLTRLVHKRLKEEDESRQKLATVIKESDRLEAMVKDMLDFSRPLKLGLTKGDLNETLREALVMVEPRATERNVTVDTDLSTTKKEGTGLGLPIALKILNAHGGTLEVLETSKEGATFRVGLPLKHH